MKSKKRIIIFIVLILILILFLSYFYNEKDDYFQDDITFFKLYGNNQTQSNTNLNQNSNNIFNSNAYFDNYKLISSNKNSFNQDNKNNYNLYIEPLEMQMTTINLMDTVDSKTLVHEKIAPGTKGSFNINVTSNQNINYKIKFESKNDKPKYLVFYKENSEKKYQNIEDMQNELNGYINAKEEQKIKINWEWQYETKEGDILQDIQDTNDAQNIRSYSFDIYVIGN